MKTRLVLILGALLVLVVFGTAMKMQDLTLRLSTRAADQNKIERIPEDEFSPSGVAMPTVDLPGWRMIFNDDFTTDVSLGSFPEVVSDKWWAYPNGWPDTWRKGTYDSKRVVSISNGMMNMTLHPENGIPYVAAPLPKIKPGTHFYGSGLTYGRYAVRFRATKTPNYYIAWLLWPDSDHAEIDGEIDYPEGGLSSRLFGFLHRRPGTTPHPTITFGNPGIVRDENWHTFILEWTPRTVRYLHDNQVYGEVAGGIPNTPMHWVLQSAYTGTLPPQPNVSAMIDIDWVAVWEYNPVPPTSTPTPTPRRTNITIRVPISNNVAGNRVTINQTRSGTSVPVSCGTPTQYSIAGSVTNYQAVCSALTDGNYTFSATVTNTLRQILGKVSSPAISVPMASGTLYTLASLVLPTPTPTRTPTRTPVPVILPIRVTVGNPSSTYRVKVMWARTVGSVSQTTCLEGVSLAVMNGKCILPGNGQYIIQALGLFSDGVTLVQNVVDNRVITVPYTGTLNMNLIF